MISWSPLSLSPPLFTLHTHNDLMAPLSPSPCLLLQKQERVVQLQEWVDKHKFNIQKVEVSQ